VLDALETLDPIYAARHDGDNTIHSCIDRTRVQVIRELKKWTKDSSDPVFWLSGRAGVGKTAVAKTFCRWLVKKKTMGGSFFVNRDDSRRMASSMVRTIAYDLAKNQPKIGQLISGAIVQCPDIISRSIPEQLQTLLMDPLRSVSKESLPVVLVIDGLNDCHRYDGYPAIKLVSTLIMIIRQQSLPVKLFVSSSDENGVHDLFVECSVSRHDLGQYEVQADIRLYYHQALASISTKRKLDRWPLYDDIGSLVDMTSHLFIFASTVIDYVDNERYSPVKRLRSLLDCPPRDALDPLDRLYRIILEDAIQDSRRGRKDNHLCQRIRKLLSAIVFVQAPLRVGDLTRLLHMDEVELRSDLRALSSVVVLPDDGIHLVRIFHSSFADFLCDEHRCLDGDLRLDSQTEHAVMTRICIDLVSEFISNVCHLEHPGTTNSEVPLLDQLITQHLPRHVQYACRYWMVHAEKAYPLKQSLVERIQDVISTHIAPWIERCSLLQCLIDVNTDLKSLSECLKVRKNSYGSLRLF
jgi:DNA polymerase III delta prime subunit